MNKVISFLAGVLVGSGITAAVSAYFLNKEKKKHEEDLNDFIQGIQDSYKRMESKDERDSKEDGNKSKERVESSVENPNEDLSKSSKDIQNEMLGAYREEVKAYSPGGSSHRNYKSSKEHSGAGHVTIVTEDDVRTEPGCENYAFEYMEYDKSLNRLEWGLAVLEDDEETEYLIGNAIEEFENDDVSVVYVRNDMKRMYVQIDRVMMPGELGDE